MHFGSLCLCLLQLPPTPFLLLPSCSTVPLKATFSVLFLNTQEKKELKRTGKIYSQKWITILTVIYKRPPERPRKPLFYLCGDNNFVWCLVVKEFYVLSVGKCQLDASLSVCYQQKWHPSFSLSLSRSFSFSLCPCLGHLYLSMAKNEAAPFQYTYNVTKKRMVFDKVYILMASVSLYSFQNMQIFN